MPGFRPSSEGKILPTVNHYSCSVYHGNSMMQTDIIVVRATLTGLGVEQGVTKRCRLSWLTNKALVGEYEPKYGGRGGAAGYQPLSTAVHTWSPNKLWRSNSIFNLWGIGRDRVKLSVGGLCLTLQRSSDLQSRLARAWKYLGSPQ